MANLELIPGEQILKQGTVDSLKGAMMQMGRGTLTNQRFVRQAQGWPGASSMFGLIGVLIARALKGKVDIEFPLTSITTLARGKFGLNKNILVIGTADGQSYMLLAKFDLWFAAFRDALQMHTGATLVQTGDQEWTVQR